MSRSIALEEMKSDYLCGPKRFQGGHVRPCRQWKWVSGSDDRRRMVTVFNR